MATADDLVEEEFYNILRKDVVFVSFKFKIIYIKGMLKIWNNFINRNSQT